MKLQEILKKPSVEKLIHSNLCRSYPQLVFEELQGKKERFRATYDHENKSIKLRGALHNRALFAYKEAFHILKKYGGHLCYKKLLSIFASFLAQFSKVYKKKDYCYFCNII
jgi:hypothetical protein